MSDITVVDPLNPAAKPAGSWRGSRLARAVHEQWAPMVPAVIMTMFLIGCVIPPSLSIGEDAGVNSPPAIMLVTSDQQVLSEPGPVRFNQQTMDTLSLSLVDTDLQDTLYVGVYVDYNQPSRLAARSKCTAPPSTNAGRTATCRLNSLCVDADVGVVRNMTIVVFDRPPDDTGAGDPPFQQMAPGGLSTSRFYFLKCEPAQL
jgi:hypothetical protein